MNAKIIVIGFTAAVLSVVVAVPALAAIDPPQGARASVAANRNLIGPSSLVQRVTRQVDAAVAAGCVTRRLAPTLKLQLVASGRMPGVAAICSSAKWWPWPKKPTAVQVARAASRSGVTSQR